MSSAIAQPSQILPFLSPLRVDLRDGRIAHVLDIDGPDLLPLTGLMPDGASIAWTRDGRHAPGDQPHALDIVAVQLVPDGPLLPVSSAGVLRSAEGGAP